MRRFFILTMLLVLTSPAWAGFGYKIEEQGAVPAASGGGGSLLVGDNTSGTIDTGTLLNPGYAIFGVYTASTSGTAAKGYARLRSTTSGNAKMVVWNAATGAVIATSSSVAISSEAVYEFTISCSITASTDYAVGVVCDCYVYIAHDAQSWALGYESNNYSTPAAIDPDNFPGGELGRPKFYLTS